MQNLWDEELFQPAITIKPELLKMLTPDKLPDPGTFRLFTPLPKHLMLRWSLERKYGEQALRLVGALYYFWQIRNHEREGHGWINQALDLAQADPALRQSGLWASGIVGYAELIGFGKDILTLRGLLEDALIIFRREHNLSGEGQALRLKGILEFSHDQRESARQRFEESLAVLQEAHDIRMAADTMFLLGVVAKYRGDFPAMRAYYQKSLDLHKTTEDLYLQLEPIEQVALDLFDQGDLPSSQRLYQETLKISEALGNSANIAACYIWLSLIAWIEGKTSPAKELAEKAYRLSEEIGFKYGLSWVCCYLGQAYWYENQIDAAYAKFVEAVETARLMADSGSIRHNLYFLSRFTFYRGNANDVRKYFDEAQNISTEDPAYERLLYLGKACFARLEKRFSEAKQYYLESLRIMRDTLGVIHIPEALEGLAALSGSSQPEHAARLFGVSQALRERMGYQRAPDQQDEIDATMQRLRERLAAKEFERLWQEGRGMTLEEALREAGVGGEAK